MKTLFFFIAIASLPFNAFAQDVFAAQRASWLQKAEAAKPKLSETEKQPLQLVTLVRDTAAYQSWKAVPAQPMDSLYKLDFKTKSGTVVDFGEHLTGWVTFHIAPGHGTPDAPVRLRFVFGEVPAEVATPFDPYPGGLSRAWLQDEVVTVMEMPAAITINRRLAFRYVKIELLGSSPYFGFTITGLQCNASTSAHNTPAPLAATADSLTRAIDRIGLTTLKECMQTVYEDGPKRDRRLWIGDLYLESLANTYSFKQHDLTKRCLYLLAALSAPDGFLHSNVFETPIPHAQEFAPFLFDYSLLYNAALNAYLTATGDKETALDLWPLAKKQLEHIKTYLRPDGLFDAAAAAKAGWWLFVDWKPELDRQAALQGIMIFALKQTYALAKQLGKENEAAAWPALIKQLTDGARKKLYNKQRGVFESGDAKQVSFASQAWMVLSGVATQAEGQRALKALQTDAAAVRPGAPYLYHYYVEALLQCGMTSQAKQAMRDYWGGMVRKGADTFWEVYDPANDTLSPYNFFPVNSYCHAWSCTPVYFIRKYADVFQK